MPLRKRSTKRPSPSTLAAGTSRVTLTSSSTSSSSTPSHSHHPSHYSPTNPHDHQFSTADRTILEELKRGLSARKSQFIIKNGQKHHSYPAKEAPYPRNYERLVIDHDVWETAFTKQLCGSLTFHVFATPPTKVLDLGCGSGSWILECARQWRECEFVGMDLVPLHPDLSHLRSNDLSSRITWVQGNCLEGLPFPNEEFDFVHIKRIAHGIPEDKWDALLEEITRVMKPGAAFEMLEEELFFPGHPRESSQPSSPSLLTTAPPDPNPSSSAVSAAPLAVPSPTASPEISLPLSVETHSVSAPDNLDATESEDRPCASDRVDASTSVTSIPASSSSRSKTSKSTKSSPTSRASPPALYSPLPVAPSGPSTDIPHPPALPSPRLASARVSSSQSQPGSPAGSPSIQHPRPAFLRSISNPANSRSSSPDGATSRHAGKGKGRHSQSHILPRSPGANHSQVDLQQNPLPPLNLLSKSAEALVPTAASRARKGSFLSEGLPATNTSTLFGSATAGPVELSSIPSSATLPLPHATSGNVHSPLRATATSPQNKSAHPPQPQNPRDHSLLEHIYNEMHAERFVNLNPLSLLANALPLYLNDVRTHAPIMFMFPPPAPSPRQKLARHDRKRTPTSHDPISETDTDAMHSMSEPEVDGTGTPRGDVIHGTHAHRFVNRGAIAEGDASRIPAVASTNGQQGHEGQDPRVNRHHRRSQLSSRRHSLEINADGRVSIDGAVIHGREILHAMQKYVLLDASSPGFLNSGMRHRGGSFASGSTTSLASSGMSRPRTSTSTSRTMFSAQTTSTPRTSISSVAEGEAKPGTAEHPSVEGPYRTAASRVNHLPNRMISFDLQSLNLHLSTRVTEIVGCKEAMWEWVVGWQSARRARLARGAKGEAIEPHGLEAELVDMSRAEFDTLVTRFEMDMQDNIALHSRIHGTFGWPRPSSQGRTAERKAFDALCGKWEEYLASLPPEVAERMREQRREQRLSRTIRVFCAWK